MLSKNLTWHEDHPYERYIQQIVPHSRWSSKIEQTLLQIWVASHYDYKIFRSKDTSTLYDLDLDLFRAQETLVEAEIKKEEKAFDDLAKKLEALQKTIGGPEEPSDHDSEEHSSEEEEVKPKKAVSKKSPQYLIKTYKSSLATSQLKLKGLQGRLEEIQAKKEAYTRYQAADQYYSTSTSRIVQHYLRTNDETHLIEELDAMFEVYATKMREGSNRAPCSGTTACETHYLPLASVSTGKPFSFQLQCRLSPSLA